MSAGVRYNQPMAGRREIMIALDLNPAVLAEPELRTRFDAAIADALAREKGWHAVGPMDLEALLAAGRIAQGHSRYTKTEQYYLLHTAGRRRPIGILESVTVELERDAG